ncbi:hypothetical protein BK411_23140 [Vibrio splendidus]|nr:hypothetical protein BK411_23140 [Vibrio splendidus]
MRMNSDLVNGYLKEHLFPKMTKETIDQAFGHLVPRLGAGEMVELLCPSCGNKGTHFLGTGSFNCESCGPTSIIDAYSNDHSVTAHRAIIELCRLAGLNIPADIYRELTPEDIKFTDIVMDIARMRVLPKEVEEWGLSVDERNVPDHLSCIPDAEQFIEYVNAVNGWVPNAVIDAITEFQGEPILLFVNKGRLVFIKLNGYSSARSPFIRSYTKGTNKTKRVFVSDDPLFIDMCWSKGLSAYFINPNFMTPRAIEFLSDEFKSKSVVAVWTKTKSQDYVFSRDQKVHRYDWFSRKVPGSYQRIAELIQ